MEASMAQTEVVSRAAEPKDGLGNSSTHASNSSPGAASAEQQSSALSASPHTAVGH